MDIALLEKLSSILSYCKAIQTRASRRKTGRYDASKEGGLVVQKSTSQPTLGPSWARVNLAAQRTCAWPLRRPQARGIFVGRGGFASKNKTNRSSLHPTMLTMKMCGNLYQVVERCTDRFRQTYRRVTKDVFDNDSCQKLTIQSFTTTRK